MGDVKAGRGVYDGGMSVYDGMTEDELMHLAKKAMFAAIAEPPGTVERAMKWAAHESIMRELARRLMDQWMRNINDKLGLPPLD